MSPIAQEIADTMQGMEGDFPEVGEADLYHDAAMNICFEWLHSGDPAKVEEANDFWLRNFGETFESRARRPL